MQDALQFQVTGLTFAGNSAVDLHKHVINNYEENSLSSTDAGRLGTHADGMKN